MIIPLFLATKSLEIVKKGNVQPLSLTLAFLHQGEMTFLMVF